MSLLILAAFYTIFIEKINNVAIASDCVLDIIYYYSGNYLFTYVNDFATPSPIRIRLSILIGCGGR
jgi:hypothetical protein